jgi:glycosyltransferase involved in cell wall biosynthesis
MYEAHCFVFPSRFEGFSGALVEAMMTGIPIISSDIPMNLEAVENNKTALVHQLKNATDLADKMQEMISNYETMIAMGKRARKVAIEKFDIKNIAKQYETLLIESVNNK